MGNQSKNLNIFTLTLRPSLAPSSLGRSCSLFRTEKLLSKFALVVGRRSLHDLSIRQIIIADPMSAKPGWHSKWIVELGTKPHTVQEPCSSASGTGQTTGSQAGSSSDHNPLVIQVPDSSPINKIKISLKFVNVISKSKWRRRTR